MYGVLLFIIGAIVFVYLTTIHFGKSSTSIKATLESFIIRACVLLADNYHNVDNNKKLSILNPLSVISHSTARSGRWSASL